MRVVPQQHVEVQVISMARMARSQDNTKHVSVNDLSSECTQELAVQTRELRAFGFPMLPYGNSKRTVRVFGDGCALRFRGWSKREAYNVESVAERVFTQPRGAIARLAASV